MEETNITEEESAVSNSLPESLLLRRDGEGRYIAGKRKFADESLPVPQLSESLINLSLQDVSESVPTNIDGKRWAYTELLLGMPSKRARVPVPEDSCKMSKTPLDNCSADKLNCRNYPALWPPSESLQERSMENLCDSPADPLDEKSFVEFLSESLSCLCLGVGSNECRRPSMSSISLLEERPEVISFIDEHGNDSVPTPLFTSTPTKKTNTQQPNLIDSISLESVSPVKPQQMTYEADGVCNAETPVLCPSLLIETKTRHNKPKSLDMGNSYDTVSQSLRSTESDYSDELSMNSISSYTSYTDPEANIRPSEHVTAKPKSRSTARDKKCSVSVKYNRKTGTATVNEVLRNKRCCMRKCIGKLSEKRVVKCRQIYWQMNCATRKQWLLEKLNQLSCTGRGAQLYLTPGMKVCQQAFMMAYGISRSVFFRVRKEFFSGLKAVGSHDTERKLSSETMSALVWIEMYATDYGDRMPHKDEVLLPVGTQKGEVYETYKIYCNEQEKTPISKSHFLRIWRDALPKLKIKKQNDNFSRCNKCALLERALRRTTDVAKRRTIKQKRKDHLDRQLAERMDYYRKRTLARESKEKYLSIIIDGMDQTKTFIPHFIGRKAKGGPLPPTLFLQADNCWRENKNKFVLAFLEVLVSLEIFNQIQFSFLYVGHTHEDIDQFFSQLANRLRVHEAETLPELLALLPSVTEIRSVQDFKSWLSPLLNNVTGHTKPLQYKIEHNPSSANPSKADIYYRGSSAEGWKLMGSLLQSKPTSRIINRRPANVQANLQKIEIHTLVSRIKTWSALFDPRDDASLNWWTSFSKELENVDGNERQLRLFSNRGSRWHLPNFSKCNKGRETTEPVEEIMGMALLEMLNEEIQEPQVIVTQNKAANPKKK